MVFVVTANYGFIGVALKSNCRPSKVEFTSSGIPDWNDVYELNRFWDTNRKSVKMYKTLSGAEKCVDRYRSLFPELSDWRIVEIKPEVLHPEYNHCLMCGSTSVVVQTRSIYEHVFGLSEGKPEFSLTEKVGLVESNNEVSYLCAECGVNLDVFDFSGFTFEEV